MLHDYKNCIVILTIIFSSCIYDIWTFPREVNVSQFATFATCDSVSSEEEREKGEERATEAPNSNCDE